MCDFGGAGKAAELAAAQESEAELTRQRRIDFGTADINRIFSNLFRGENVPGFTPGGVQSPGFNQIVNALGGTPPGIGEEDIRRIQGLGGRLEGAAAASPFLNQLEQDFITSQTTDLNKQRSSTLDRLSKDLARAGLSDSSVAAQQRALFQEQDVGARAGIATRASAFRGSRQAEIEQARQGLLSDLNLSANPAAAASSALASAGTLTAAPEFSALGNVFSVGLNTAADIEEDRSLAGRPSIFSPTRQSSQRVIR